MNIETLLKLKNNPHYKLSDKQKAFLNEYERKPMIEFGLPKLHNQSFPKNDTSFVQKRRTTI